MKKIFISAIAVLYSVSMLALDEVNIWHKYELTFESKVSYQNPVYDVGSFNASFTAPSGKLHKVSGFWDGGQSWKIRFMPDETGTWHYETFCSNEDDEGLHRQSGSFKCVASAGGSGIYSHGAVIRPNGSFYLTHADGTPFFWLACTAWNGALKSTDEEWHKYLTHRRDHGYNVIQFVTTQWRGCDKDSQGEIAFRGSGRIEINPGFFQRMDQKVDEINEYGMVAAPVLLWALPFGEGTELSPGYYLPDREAILLARYIVARYQAHHVVWILGGDGKYYGELEDRWKYIGREVFKDDPPGPVTHHPHGQSWIGNLYAGEEWMDIVGYQSSHSNSESTVNFITRNEVALNWDKIPPKPIINLEPCYEQIHNRYFADDVRNACWWSVFATPPAGITYGADGIWPWLREGERHLNHGYNPGASTWDKSIELPGSIQISYLKEFMSAYPWWELLPAQDLLLEQPGDADYRHHVSVLKSRDNNLIMLYSPVPNKISLRIPGSAYSGQWFDPVVNKFKPASLQIKGHRLDVSTPGGKDMILVLEHK